MLHYLLVLNGWESVMKMHGLSCWTIAVYYEELIIIIKIKDMKIKYEYLFTQGVKKKEFKDTILKAKKIKEWYPHYHYVQENRNWICCYLII